MAYVREVCPDCGNLTEDCSDPTSGWYPQRRVCHSRMTVDFTWRRLREKHKEHKGLSEPHPTDGVTVWASQQDLTPDDNFV